MLPTPTTKRLTTREKTDLLNNIAIGFFATYPISQKAAAEMEIVERNAIYQLIWDNLLFSKNSQIAEIREKMRILHNSHQHKYTDIALFLYSPSTVDLLFEKAIEQACFEASIDKNDQVDKCFKMRSYLRNCQEDLANDISVIDSHNPAATMIIKIAKDYDNLLESSKHSSKTRQATLLEY